MINVFLPDPSADVGVQYTAEVYRNVFGEGEDTDRLEGVIIQPDELYGYLCQNHKNVRLWRPTKTDSLVCTKLGDEYPPEAPENIYPVPSELPVDTTSLEANVRQEDRETFSDYIQSLDVDYNSYSSQLVAQWVEEEVLDEFERGRVYSDRIQYHQPDPSLDRRHKRVLDSDWRWLGDRAVRLVEADTGLEKIGLHFGPTDNTFSNDLDLILWDSPNRRIGEDEEAQRKFYLGNEIYEFYDESYLIRSKESLHPLAEVSSTETGMAVFVLKPRPFGTSGPIRRIFGILEERLSETDSTDEFLSSFPLHLSDWAVNKAADNLQSSAETPEIFQQYEEYSSRAESKEEVLNTYRRQLSAKREELSHLQNIEDDQAYLLDQAESQLDRIRSHNKVKDVRFNERGDNLIWVYTKHLLVRDDRDDDIHSLGEFEIVIATNHRSTNSIHAYNLTREVDAHSTHSQAPHVFERGNMCAGNFGDIVNEPYDNGDWYTVISETIRFLESANTDDCAGELVSRWPEADAELLDWYKENCGPLPQ